MAICLTFDLELWPVPSDYRVPFSRDTSRLVVSGVKRILSLLERHNARSTFFISGAFLDAYPGLVSDIAGSAIEVAAHGNAHVDYSLLSGDAIFDDAASVTRKIKDLFGVRPFGFRAPRCRLRPELVSALFSLGYRYDSSLHPTFIPGNYNHLGMPAVPFLFSNGLAELPISTGVFRIPLSWCFFRNLGLPWTNANVGRLVSSGRDVVLYFHPWEFVDMPVLNGVPFYVHRNAGERLVRMLDLFMERFSCAGFKAVCDVI